VVTYHPVRTDNLPELIDRFAERIAPLGVHVQRVGSTGEAADIVREVSAELLTSSLLVSAELLERFPDLRGELKSRALEITVAHDPHDSRDAPLGLTTAKHAIAETGSLLTSESTLADRSVALLSLVLIAILPASAILPGLDAAVHVLRSEAKKPGGAYTTFITGPSRTADIELSLTVGVQGPGRVIVLFVDDGQA
jgi:L-lactate dehydrogenase complex protein LldG